MKKFPIIIAVALALAMLLGGCNLYGPQPGATPAPNVTASRDIEPQMLISKDEAQKLVGNDLAAPVIKPAMSPAQSAMPSPSGSPADGTAVLGTIMCFYEKAHIGSSSERFLQITVYQTTQAMADQKVSARMYFDVLKGKGPSTLSDAALEIITDVGEGDQKVDLKTAWNANGSVEAFILPPGIHIAYRGYYIVIGVGDPYSEDNDKILMAAGKHVVNKLDGILGAEPQPQPSAALQPSPSATAQ